MTRRKKAPPAGALLLAPGAGAGRDQDQLVAIDEAATAAGFVVDRIDFPYRRAGRRAPDRPPVLLEAVREAAAALAARAGVAPGEVVLGGRSMGGRICSMAVAGGLAARGLVLVSYPLRPPGRPDKLVERTAHFPSLFVPCLFVSGTRDGFGSPVELESATAAIPGAVRHEWIEGSDHSLRGRSAPVADRVRVWLCALG